MICFLDSGVLETKTLTAPAEVQTRKTMINYQPQLVIFFGKPGRSKRISLSIDSQVGQKAGLNGKDILEATIVGGLELQNL